jgi:hypothetical protein
MERLIFEPIVDENAVMNFISIVEDPAIMVKGIALSKLEIPLYDVKFNEDKQTIFGPVLIPDLEIERYDKEIGTFYLKFSKEKIKEVFELYQRTIKDKKINLDHRIETKSAYPLSMWIKEDDTHDKSILHNYDLPIGTWFMEVKVDYREEYLKLKELNMTSFSIEGMFNLKQLNLKKINDDMEENKVESTEVESVKTKLEITPEDVAMIWEAIKPMVEEMMKVETEEEVKEEEAPVEMKVEETKLSTINLEDLVNEITELKRIIKETPAVETPKQVNFKRDTDFQNALERIERMKNLNKK